MFFLIYRPDLLEPDVWKSHVGFHRFDLKPFTPVESRVLFDAILPAIELPAGVIDQVIARAAGIPFYLEEIIKSFTESGAIYRDGDHWVASRDVEQFHVPETVQAILRTRIDRLDDAPKRVLQQAAVIGRRFKRSLLAEISEVRPIDEHLETLTKLEFMYPHTEDNDVFSFQNVLAQEVAYSVLLVRRRRTYHRRIAEVYERLYADRLDGHVDDLSYHAFQAELWPKALLWGKQAGDQAKALYANAEAIAHYRRCLTAIDRMEEVLSTEWEENQQPDLSDLNRDALVARRLEITMELGEVQSLIGAYDDALATYRVGHEVAITPALRAEIAWRMADGIHIKRAKWQDALDVLALATTDVEQEAEQPLRLLSKIETSLSMVYFRLQKLDDARRIAEECIARLDGTNYFAELARAQKQLGLVGFMTGDFDLARTQFERGLEVARHTNDPREIGPFYNNLGVVAFRQGRHEDANLYFSELLTQSELTGDVWSASNALTSLGNCARIRHELDAAILFHERSAKIKARIGDPRGLMLAYHNMAEVLGDKDDRVRAIETLEKSLIIARDVAARETIPAILRQVGEHRLALGEDEIAEHCGQEALDLATAINGRLEMALSTRLLARIDLRRPAIDRAIERLIPVIASLRELKSSHELAVTLLDLAEAQIEVGQSTDADATLVEADPLLAKAGTPPERERLSALREKLPAAA